MVWRIKFLNWVTNSSTFLLLNFKFLFASFAIIQSPCIDCKYKTKLQAKISPFDWYVNCGIGFVLVWSAALQQITKSLACEWAKDNIRVTCVLLFGQEFLSNLHKRWGNLHKLSLNCVLYFPLPRMNGNYWLILLIEWLNSACLGECLNSLVIPMYFWLNLWISWSRC
jgi:hypothetical protein